MNMCGPKRFGAIVSDNGGGCEKGRRLTKEAFPHLVIQRCMMHGFALIMGSVFGHKSAVHIISKCQKLVTLTKSSYKLKRWVHEENMADKHGVEISKSGTASQKAVLEIIFNQVCQAMQAKDFSLADAGPYLILLAKTLKVAAADSTLNPDFLAHAFTVYNRRWEQMGTPLIRLALFLHPGYRVVGTQADEFKTLCKQVCIAYHSLACI
ncbi:TPA: hypothetical protein ACH3X1_010835 [Trebouxia sp. C0004]